MRNFTAPSLAWRGLLAAVCTLPLFSGVVSAAPPAGEVVLAAGPVYLKSEQHREPVQRGARLEAGQTLVTGEGGFAHVRMADGGLVAVRPLSVFEIEVFQYEGSAHNDRVRYRLDEGVARAITGGVGEINKEAFRLNTPVAAVGVRGTDFVVATTSSASRVAINSGAVVVAALGEHCSAASFGSCADGAVVLGKAESLPGQFVEVVRGEQLPRLVEDPQQTPDQLAPPHADEPRVNSSQSLPDTREGEVSVTVDVDTGGTPVSPAPVEPPPSANDIAMPEGVHWGRWSSTEAVDGATVQRVSDLLSEGKEVHVVNTQYGAGFNERATQLPRSGRADFVAAGGEGVWLGADSSAALSVASGRLGVDFDRSSFDTHAEFTDGAREFQTQASGTINAQGFLRSDPALSNARVTGALGKDLDSAITTVERQFDDGQLSGIVVWGRP